MEDKQRKPRKKEIPRPRFLKLDNKYSSTLELINLNSKTIHLYAIMRTHISTLLLVRRAETIITREANELYLDHPLSSIEHKPIICLGFPEEKNNRVKRNQIQSIKIDFSLHLRRNIRDLSEAHVHMFDDFLSKIEQELARVE